MFIFWRHRIQYSNFDANYWFIQTNFDTMFDINEKDGAVFEHWSYLFLEIL